MGRSRANDRAMGMYVGGTRKLTQTDANGRNTGASQAQHGRNIDATDDTHRQDTSAALTSSTFLTTASTMSLPRSNYDPRRVCINPFPAITLGKHRRTIGIYLAGGLVRLFCLDVPYVI